MNSYKENEFDISCLPDKLLEFSNLTISFDLTSKQILANLFGEPNQSFTSEMLLWFLTKIYIEKILETLKWGYCVVNFFLPNLTFSQSCLKKYDYLFGSSCLGKQADFHQFLTFHIDMLNIVIQSYYFSLWFDCIFEVIYSFWLMN